SRVPPTPFDLRTPNPRHQPIEPAIDWHRVIRIARDEGGRRGWEPLGDVIYADRFAIYQARYYRAGDGHGAGGVGPTTLFIDGMNGQILGERLPWHGTVADIFVQAQFPLHSGRILGLPGRILISIMGIVAAMLSVTGVLIWWRRRRARLLVQPVARVATGTDTIERDSSPCDGSRPTLTLRSIPVRHLDRRLPRM
ncbi:MAG TPA: PepSY-associated TM helix domain-containing protein, partial [Burkholderiaceae bacterium]|nr:PepSY-associated TM helix domain-containing protein [Burkholderiaceae bacterium]